MAPEVILAMDEGTYNGKVSGFSPSFCVCVCVCVCMWFYMYKVKNVQWGGGYMCYVRHFYMCTCDGYMWGIIIWYMCKSVRGYMSWC